MVVLSILAFVWIWKVNNGAKLANYSNISALFDEKKSILSQFEQKHHAKTQSWNMK